MVELFWMAKAIGHQAVQGLPLDPLFLGVCPEARGTRGAVCVAPRRPTHAPGARAELGRELGDVKRVAVVVAEVHVVRVGAPPGASKAENLNTLPTGRAAQD